MNLPLPHPHPIARATGSIRGHHLHIGRPVDQLGYVASCSCEHWATWKHARQDAVRSFHRHLHLVVTDRSAA